MGKSIVFVSLTLALVLACEGIHPQSDRDPVKEAFHPFLFERSLEEAIEIIGANPDTLPFIPTQDDDYFSKIGFEDPPAVYYIESKGSKVLTTPGYIAGVRAIVGHLSDQDGAGTIYCVSTEDEQAVRTKLSDLFGPPQSDQEATDFGLEMWSSMTFTVMKVQPEPERALGEPNRIFFVATTTDTILDE